METMTTNLELYWANTQDVPIDQKLVKTGKKLKLYCEAEPSPLYHEYYQLIGQILKFSVFHFGFP